MIQGKVVLATLLLSLSDFNVIVVVFNKGNLAATRKKHMMVGKPG